MPRIREVQETGQESAPSSSRHPLDVLRQDSCQEKQWVIDTHNNLYPNENVKAWLNSLDEADTNLLISVSKKLASNSILESNELEHAQRIGGQKAADLFTTYKYWLDPSRNPSMCPDNLHTPEDRTEQIVVLAHHMAKFTGNQGASSSFRAYMRNNFMKKEEWEIFSEEFKRVLMVTKGEITKSNIKRLTNTKPYYTSFMFGQNQTK